MSVTLSRLVHRLRHDLGGVSDEADLLAVFRASGDPAAFEALVRRHGPAVFAACRRVLPGEADAEDAFQATFLVLLRSAPAIRNPAALGGWLVGVAHRVALKAVAAAARRRRAEAIDPPPPGGPPDLAWSEACRILHQELDALPDRHRLPLVLCYLEGHTRDEAARLLDVPLGVLRGRLERGRETLRARLQRRGVSLSAGLLAAATNSGPTVGPSGPLIQRTFDAVTSPAPAPVAALARGVESVTFTKKMTTALLALALTLGLGLAWARPTTPEPPPAPPTPPRPAAPTRPAEKADTVTLSGRVLGPDSKPVAGARLFVPTVKNYPPRSEDDLGAQEVGTTGPDGRFAVAVKPPMPQLRQIVAVSPGLGIDWAEFGGKGLADPVAPPPALTLRLPRDVPVTGRVVNTEGRPVASVSVDLASLREPLDGDIEAHVAELQKNLRDALSSPVKRLHLPLHPFTGPTTTDADGRFTLRGLGADRVALVTLHGGGIARSQPWVITRAGFDPKPLEAVLLRKEYDDLRVLNRFLPFRGPSFTFVAEPGKTLSGVVTDAATGKPIPGCALMGRTGFGDGVRTTTDAAGRYTLTGLPRDAKGYFPSIMPPREAGYLVPPVHAPDTDGLAPVRLVIRLSKGSFVVGRITEKGTGRGVSAGVRFAPLPTNKLFGTKPEYSAYRSDHTMQSTDAEGRFRLSTIPGPCIVLVQAHGGDKFADQYLNPFRRATPDPDHKGLFRHDRDDDSWTVATAGTSLESLNGHHAVKVIDVTEGGETRADLTVDRGVTGTLHLQDADGKPVAGAWVAGLTDSWPLTFRVPTDSAPVHALDPARPRALVVYHPGKGLGAVVSVRGDEKGPVVVKLGALGRVTGRLKDAEGEPLAGARMGFSPRTELGRELVRFATPPPPPVTTDKDGRFTLTGVVPGLPFYLETRKGDQFFGGRPKIGPREVKAGETLDLGDRTMEPLR